MADKVPLPKQRQILTAATTGAPRPAVDQLQKGFLSNRYPHPNLPIVADVSSVGDVRVRSQASADSYTLGSKDGSSTMVYQSRQRQPVLAFHWLASERVYNLPTAETAAQKTQGYTPATFHPDLPAVRQPFRGPRNIYGPLAFLIVTARNEVHLYYQYDGALFTSKSAPLPCAGLAGGADSLGAGGVQLAHFDQAPGPAGQYLLTVVRRMDVPHVAVYEIRINFAAGEPTLRPHTLGDFALAAPSGLSGCGTSPSGGGHNGDFAAQQIVAVRRPDLADATFSLDVIIRAKRLTEPQATSIIQLWQLRRRSTSSPTAATGEDHTEDPYLQYPSPICTIAQCIATATGSVTDCWIATYLRPTALHPGNAVVAISAAGHVRLFDPQTLAEHPGGFHCVNHPVADGDLPDSTPAPTFRHAKVSCGGLMAALVTVEGNQVMVPMLPWSAWQPGIVTAAYWRVLASLHNSDVLDPTSADALVLVKALRTMRGLFATLPSYHTELAATTTFLKAMDVTRALNDLVPLDELATVRTEASERWMTGAIVDQFPRTLALLRTMSDLAVGLARDGYVFFNSYAVDAHRSHLSRGWSSPEGLAPSAFATLFHPLYRHCLRQSLRLVDLMVTNGEVALKHHLNDQRQQPAANEPLEMDTLTLALQHFVRHVKTALPLPISQVAAFLDRVEVDIQAANPAPKFSTSVPWDQQPWVQSHLLATAHLGFKQNGLVPYFTALETSAPNVPALLAKVSTAFHETILAATTANRLIFYALRTDGMSESGASALQATALSQVRLVTPYTNGLTLDPRYCTSVRDTV
ncbi:hypothetical protein IWQ60_001218 [Tieghemiomyces parasiticus]|uniref:Uncharacterized protein n=1 Tax=Tieghemiomyces parasiticus TaxID=78921 RepID=A0A9W8AKZ8_9FUNG|nr:hypothetical protein IWQ60_001218 [Tieghemiomyces parasiticus]